MTGLDHRQPQLVLAIIGHVYDADGPIRWPELVEHFADDRHGWKTIENTIYELIQFGALHKIGKPADRRRRPDTRALKPTTLGRAWLERQLLPLPTDDPEQEPT